MDATEFLEHYGVKGMKWGVRRKRSSERVTAADRARKMSDDELRSAVNRLQMEKQYRDLSNTLSKRSGNDIAADLLKSYGKTAMGIVTSSVTAHYVRKALNKSMPGN